MTAALRVVMMGTGTFARPTFVRLLAEPAVAVVGLVTQPDRAGAQVRGSTRLTGITLKALAEERGVPVLQPESVNTPEAVAALRAWQADLLVVAAYGQILAPEVLRATRWGGINVHGSLLPRYRGAAPVAWAILRGETRTGVTIIRISAGLDAGLMLARAELEIGADETSGELEARLAPLGAELALEVLARLRDAGEIDQLPGIAQDPALVTRAPKIRKEQGRIDWAQPAEQLVRQIRAMQPWPTAYTHWLRAGQAPVRLAIQAARAHAGEASATPGVILPSADVGLRVAAGQGTLEILALQPAGKRRMRAEEFLRGRAVRPGDHFGDA